MVRAGSRAEWTHGRALAPGEQEDAKHDVDGAIAMLEDDSLVTMRPVWPRIDGSRLHEREDVEPNARQRGVYVTFKLSSLHSCFEPSFASFGTSLFRLRPSQQTHSAACPAQPSADCPLRHHCCRDSKCPAGLWNEPKSVSSLTSLSMQLRGRTRPHGSACRIHSAWTLQLTRQNQVLQLRRL